MIHLFKPVDIVARKSYGMDILFKIADTKSSGRNIDYVLKGIDYRIEADAPETDLILQTRKDVDMKRSAVRSKVENKTRSAYAHAGSVMLKKAVGRDTPKDNSVRFSRPGKVLHLDGDNEYLSTCLEEYRKMGVDATGRHVAEKEQPAVVFRLLNEHRPDILVLTGHDGVAKTKEGFGSIANYRNSKYFVESVREARRFDPDFDGLIIFAGACQSMYPEIISAGANFASSPRRVLIHALDPVLVSQKVANTSFNAVLSPNDVIGVTITGADGIGGLQVRGKYRSGYPKDLF